MKNLLCPTLPAHRKIHVAGSSPSLFADNDEGGIKEETPPSQSTKIYRPRRFVVARFGEGLAFFVREADFAALFFLKMLNGR
jgi:hypothetical protein